jgi:hypothetical protein
MHYITYRPEGRLGNNLFQYMTCKLLEHESNGTHAYIDYIHFLLQGLPSIQYTDADFQANAPLQQSHIICNGYYQRSSRFVANRDYLRSIIPLSTDLFIHKLADVGEIRIDSTHYKRYPIRELFAATPTCSLQPGDLVLSLRLDDFMGQSDLVPPSFYIQLLTQIPHKRVVILCDTLRHDWEKAYVQQLGPCTLVQGRVQSDFACMRQAERLIHSNSTLCWLAGFFGQASKRWIPRTFRYGGQELLEIGPTDEVIPVQPLNSSHIPTLIQNAYIHPFSYGIPDELIVTSVPPKSELFASIVPGNASNYTYTVGQEAEYYATYQRARFAYTTKKGGWDALRHYEILANGCIPVIDFTGCPSATMTTFPKDLIQEANRNLLPYTDEKAALYDTYVTQLLDYTRTRLSSSALAKSFLSTLQIDPASGSILILRCDPGPNYSREMLTIGLKRLLGSRCTHYPSSPFLHSDYPTESLASLHGRGYTYTRRLDPVITPSDQEIIEGLKERRWSAVLYGKNGPDDGQEGTVPFSPLWSIVKTYYSRDQIAFLYGGDGCQDLTTTNHYAHHLLQQIQFGHCFVRELAKI